MTKENREAAFGAAISVVSELGGTMGKWDTEDIVNAVKEMTREWEKLLEEKE